MEKYMEKFTIAKTNCSGEMAEIKVTRTKLLIPELDMVLTYETADHSFFIFKDEDGCRYYVNKVNCNTYTAECANPHYNITRECSTPFGAVAKILFNIV